MMLAQPAILAQGLVKSFGGRPVIRQLDLTLDSGETLALVGHNGSGKTTLIRLLAGLARPNAGVITINGIPQGPNVTAVHRSIGVVSHNTFLYRDLTPVENLRFYGSLYDTPDMNRRIDVLLDRFGLTGYRDAPVRALSRGTQQRLALARALLPDPAIVLLDEPDSGLDPQAIDMLPGLLEMADLGGRAVLLTSHNLGLSLALAQRVAILARGRLVWQSDTAGLTAADLRDAYDAHLPVAVPVRATGGL